MAQKKKHNTNKKHRRWNDNPRPGVAGKGCVYWEACQDTELCLYTGACKDIGRCFYWKECNMSNS